MTSTITLTIASLLLMVLLLAPNDVDARYLPTRSNGDRIDKLRELLKGLLESELDKEESDPQRWRPEGKYLIKREAKLIRELPGTNTNKK